MNQWQRGWAMVWHDVIQLSYAPLTEEPAKLLPWLLLSYFGMRLFPSRKLVVPLAMTIGLSFAIGEFWLVVIVVLSLVCLCRLHFGKSVLRRIWQARMICPECGAVYKQPIILGLNAGTWRYEPCGACRKWHWVSIKNLAPLKAIPDRQESPPT